MLKNLAMYSKVIASAGTATLEMKEKPEEISTSVSPKEQPEKLEKSDEVPEVSADVQLDSTAIPSGSLATDTQQSESPSVDKETQVTFFWSVGLMASHVPSLHFILSQRLDLNHHPRSQSSALTASNFVHIFAHATSRAYDLEAFCRDFSKGQCFSCRLELPQSTSTTLEQTANSMINEPSSSQKHTQEYMRRSGLPLASLRSDFMNVGCCESCFGRLCHKCRA